MNSIILGIDPGLQKTGWGVIAVEGTRHRFLGCGTIKPPTKLPLSERLFILNDKLQELIANYRPTQAAIEETFVSVNGASTLKLGQARGALLLSLSLADLPVSEYAANLIKKTMTGSGHADKQQIGRMVATLLPKARAEIEQAGEDARDALAIALCHAQHLSLNDAMKKASA